jgi:hypothetical protein
MTMTKTELADKIKEIYEELETELDYYITRLKETESWDDLALGLVGVTRATNRASTRFAAYAGVVTRRIKKEAKDG